MNTMLSLLGSLLSHQLAATDDFRSFHLSPHCLGVSLYGRIMDGSWTDHGRIMNGWMAGWVDGRMYVCTHVCMRACWVDVRMSVIVCMSVCMPVCVCVCNVV